jgi:uncharacterized protein (DUF3084 family)
MNRKKPLPGCHDRKPKPNNNALVVRLLKQLNRKADKIMGSQAEAAQALRDLATSLGNISTQLTKATAEIIAALQNQQNVTPELQAAVDALTPIKDSLAGESQTLDDLNPDTP